MTWLPDRYQRLQEQLRRGDVDPDVLEELQHHLASRVEDNIRAGMPREEAIREATQRFGDLEKYRRETRAVEHETAAAESRRERLAVARQEIKRAWRSLRKNPSFSVTAILTLAVGLGATIAVFTLLDAVVFRPLTYPDADRLVRIYHPVPKVESWQRWDISQAEFFHFQSNAKSLSAVGLYQSNRLTILSEGLALQVDASQVSASMLGMLGARARLGRLFTTGDQRSHGSPAVLLSEAFWRSQYGADSAAIGSRIRLEGTEATVVGVVTAGVDLPDAGTDIWLATQMDPSAPPRNNHVFGAVARLAPGATVEAASRELAAMVPSYLDRFAGAYDQKFLDGTGFTTLVVPWKADLLGGSTANLWLVFGAVIILMLVAAFNIGNLFLARSQQLSREIQVRTILGANRGQLAWHHFAESGLIGLAAGVLGVGLAGAALKVLVAALGPEAIVPRLADVGLGAMGLGFAAAMTGLVILVFGLLPMVASSRPALRSGRGMTASGRESTVRNVLVVAQIALAVVLVAGAGLMIRTFRNLQAVRPGFDPAGVLVMDVALPYNSYNKYERTTAYYRNLVTHVRALPAVVNAAVASDLPIEAADGCSVFEYPSRPPNVSVDCILNAVVGPGYFSTLGIALEGRDLAWTDLDSKTGAVLISERLAARLWPGEPALDRQVSGPANQVMPAYFRVAGVVQGLRWRGLASPPSEVAFFPLEPIPGTWLWSPPARMSLVVKVKDTDPTSIVPAIRRIVSDIEPEAAVGRPRTMDQIVATSLTRVRMMMAMLGVASAGALALSMVGLYGVIGYLVTRRTQEIGIRIALGAPIALVRHQVVRQSLWLGVVGVGLGLLGAISVTGFLRSMLFDVRPTDPLTLIVAAASLLVVAGVASFVPANRAARIDPIEALRAE